MRGHKGVQYPNRNQRYVDQSNLNNNRGRGRGKGRGSFRAKNGHRGKNNRHTPYNKNKRLEKREDQANANLAGKSSELNYTNKNISFIADSGTTEHLTNKWFLLKDFVKNTKGEIKSANKCKKANIKIDGKGDLYLKNSENKIITLSNVIAAHNLSREFAFP